MKNGFVKYFLRPALAAIISVAIIGIGYAAYCRILIADGNFHTVVDGQLYRSAQLSGNEFVEKVADNHIKSILNLRGPRPGSGWYDNELAIARERGIMHYDVAISANELVSQEKINQIIAILRDSPKPLLIHCKSGSDRTGLVSALYRYAIQGQSPVEADSELSLLYGHFPYLTNRTGAMDASFNIYVQKTRLKLCCGAMDGQALISLNA